MNNQAREETAARSVERFDRNADRTIKDEGYGATVGALKITKEYGSELATAITATLSATSKDGRSGPVRLFARVASKLPPATVAYAVLNRLINSIIAGDNIANAAIAVGTAVQAECWAADLLATDEKLRRRIELKARNLPTLEARRRAAVKEAERCEYTGRSWSKKAIAAAGSLLLDCAVMTLPELFFYEDRTYRSSKDGVAVEWMETFPQITPTGTAMAAEAVEQAIRNAPVFVPCREAPAQWTSLTEGGYWSARDRFQTTFVRARHKATRAVVGSAMRTGTMAAHVNGVNALQAVPWRINGEILSLMQWCVQHNINVKGLPDAPQPMPERVSADDWADMDDDARRFAAWKRKGARGHNLRVASREVAMARDVEYARQLLDAERFYTPMNCDWRGRVYCTPTFNFQRDDRVRALFQFTDGEPMTEDGLYWLKVHVANTGAFDKLDKKPFSERIAWVNKNLERIKALAFDPKSTSSVDWWKQADKPFLFLAACLELSEALTGTSSFMTRLPVSFDGSCSGLQHLSAMTRAPEGALVNLVPMDAPQDVYQTVADKLRAIIERERFSRKPVTFRRFTITEGKLARMAEMYGIDRKLVKRQVMTFPYSSKEAGMREQIVEDTMKKLEDAVIKGDLPRHPFGEDNGRAAAHYLSQRIYKVIADTVSLPAQAMGFLRKCAKALAHEGKVLDWTTPTGLPWSNRYYEQGDADRVRLFLSHKTVQIKLTTDSPRVAKEKVANAVSPNFVHACDAAHLIRSANTCHAEGIQLATVHDSFGCHAPKATRMNAIIRDEFVKMYQEHDVLAEVREATARALSDHSRHPVPDLPQYGSLNLTEIRNARYAFA